MKAEPIGEPIGIDVLDEAVGLLEKANASLPVESLDIAEAKRRLARYARAQRLASFGVAALASVVDRASVARETGMSSGRAKDTVETGKVLGTAPEFCDAFRRGDISLDQASEIARVEASVPGVAVELVAVAKAQGFAVVREKARKAKLEAEQHRGLATRQHEARSARSYCDELGMIHVHLALEPHVGTPVVARAEAEAARLYRAASDKEPFERYLANAYVGLLCGNGKGRAKRPELVVLVSHEVIKRGWNEVRSGEVCKIPGVAPVAPRVAKGIAEDAFLSGVFYDGTDLRHFKRWNRHIPIEVAIALELGKPLDFDGVVCSKCGNRFHTEFDHVEPYSCGGPTSLGNFDGLCWVCHSDKTERDRRAGKLPSRAGPGRFVGIAQRR